MNGWSQQLVWAVCVLLGCVLAPTSTSAAPSKPCSRVIPGGDAAKFNKIVEKAVTPEQMKEMVSGIGEAGILADGSGKKSYLLPSGATVPAATGSQPLVYAPMAPLPMPDNPGLLDEYASGGVHTDGYNSSTSPLPGPKGVRPLAVVSPVHDEEIRACTPLLRDTNGYLASLCISLFTQSELVLFDPNDGFKLLARTSIPKRSTMLDPAGGWYTRMDHLGRPLVPTVVSAVGQQEADVRT